MYVQGHRIRIAIVFADLLALWAGTEIAEPTETEIANVTSEAVELRTSGGVTRLAIRYLNSDAINAESSRISVDHVVLVKLPPAGSAIPWV